MTLEGGKVSTFRESRIESIHDALHEASQPPQQQSDNERKAHRCVVGELILLMTVGSKCYDKDEDQPCCNADSLLPL